MEGLVGKVEVEGDLFLREHEAVRWLTKDELRSVDWLPADLSIIDKIEELLKDA